MSENGRYRCNFMLVKVFKIYFVGYKIKIRLRNVQLLGEWVVLYLISSRHGALVVQQWGYQNMSVGIVRRFKNFKANTKKEKTPTPKTSHIKSPRRRTRNTNKFPQFRANPNSTPTPTAPFMLYFINLKMLCTSTFKYFIIFHILTTFY